LGPCARARETSSALPCVVLAYEVCSSWIALLLRWIVAFCRLWLWISRFCWCVFRWIVAFVWFMEHLLPPCLHLPVCGISLVHSTGSKSSSRRIRYPA